MRLDLIAVLIVWLVSLGVGMAMDFRISYFKFVSAFALYAGCRVWQMSNVTMSGELASRKGGA